MPSTAIFMLEDDPNMQNRLARILEGIDMPPRPLYKAASIQEAKQLMDQHTWSLAMVDMGLPDGYGMEVIEALHQKNPNLPIVVISAWSTRDMVLAALQAGACGYVLKERDDVEVAISLRSVLRGGSPIDPFIARGILAMLSAEQEKSESAAAQPAQANPLTRREFQVLEFVSGGLSNREIAEDLNLAKETVECHIRSIYRKLGVNSRTKAIFTARSQGWLS